MAGRRRQYQKQSVSRCFTERIIPARIGGDAMPDIKTKNVVKGTVKTIDKSAVAAERMKDAYIAQRTKRSTAFILQRVQPKNMPQI